MKKLILITGILVYTFFAVAMIADAGKGEKSSEQVQFETFSTEVVTEIEPQELYVVKSDEGRIAVLDAKTGEIIKKTDTIVSILPEEDRRMLNEGIKVESDEKLRLLLEDFCS
ncbi:MAG: hypothetical protein J1E41_05440 [Ruminococcus sp.]|nr:hypothetical protein [Ruminococcus sp.]